MKQERTILLAVILLLPFFTFAQKKTFTITGGMLCDSLRFTPERVEKVYLHRLAEGKAERIDSALVVDKKFTFTGSAPEYTQAAFISGFDNGNVQFLLEEGNIVIEPFDAHFPVTARIAGTRNNEIWNNYQLISQRMGADGTKKIEEILSAFPETEKEDMFKLYQPSVFYSGNIYYKLNVLDYFYDNIDSEAALYMIRYDLNFFFSPDVVEGLLLNVMPERLRQHPCYEDIMNQVKAGRLKEGEEVPGIWGFTPEGERLRLSDFKGKYVLLDFWASWCGPCRREFPFIKKALELSAIADNFVVFSFSIDDKKADWLSVIEKQRLVHDNWIHVSTLEGWDSEAVRLYNFKGIPHTLFLDPEGKVIEFGLRGEELIKKVEGIIK